MDEKPAKTHVIKVDLDPTQTTCKRVWVRLDAIKRVEVVDGFACVTIDWPES